VLIQFRGLGRHGEGTFLTIFPGQADRRVQRHAIAAALGHHAAADGCLSGWVRMVRFQVGVCRFQIHCDGEIRVCSSLLQCSIRHPRQVTPQKSLILRSKARTASRHEIGHVPDSQAPRTESSQPCHVTSMGLGSRARLDRLQELIDFALGDRPQGVISARAPLGGRFTRGGDDV
jgi:hypothetical protein